VSSKVVESRSERAGLPAIAGGLPVRDAQAPIVFGVPAIGQEEIDAVVDCLRRRWISTGPMARQLEVDFEAYKGGGSAVAVSSGTAALHLALVALGVGPGDEVITSPMTFCSTVNAIIHAGATPVLADCDPVTMNIDPARIRERITPKTRAILPVHMCGRICDMDAIMAIARERGLLVVEDCAHAIESTCSGRPAGLIGDVGCFSFYATKNVTTAEGGVLLARDPGVAELARELCLHGMSADAWSRFSRPGYKHYEVVRYGFKYNLPDMNAALGVVQLKKVEARALRRGEIWQRYNEAFAGLPCTTPAAPAPGTRHAWHLYTPLLSLERLSVSRDRVLEALKAENIGCGVHYVPVHAHKYFRETWGWKRGEFPGAEHVGDRTLSLPLTAEMDDRAVEDVIRGFGRILEYFRI
jgi:dTDP-4-amino-4,6-dideoxygalactose transaminase